jgi:hypothetical protein
MNPILNGIFSQRGPAIDQYTMSLLHFNGDDASTAITDLSGKTWTAYDNAQLDTAQKKFGASSLLLDGTGDYIDTPDSPDFTLGSSDFTIEMWVRRFTAGTTQYLLGQGDSSAGAASLSVAMYFNSGNNLAVQLNSGTTPYQIVSSVAITNDSAWYHIALVRYVDAGKLYIGGTESGSVNLTGVTINNSANKFTIGRLGEYTGGNYFNGWIDEYRQSVGVARYTGNFTPPSSEFTS